MKVSLRIVCWDKQLQKILTPVASKLPGSESYFPYVFNRNDAFPLWTNLMKPHANSNLDIQKFITKYLISRARRTRVASEFWPRDFEVFEDQSWQKLIMLCLQQKLSTFSQWPIENEIRIVQTILLTLIFKIRKSQDIGEKLLRIIQEWCKWETLIQITMVTTPEKYENYFPTVSILEGRTSTMSMKIAEI